MKNLEDAKIILEMTLERVATPFEVTIFWTGYQLGKIEGQMKVE